MKTAVIAELVDHCLLSNDRKKFRPGVREAAISAGLHAKESGKQALIQAIVTTVEAYQDVPQIDWELTG